MGGPADDSRTLKFSEGGTQQRTARGKFADDKRTAARSTAACCFCLPPWLAGRWAKRTNEGLRRRRGGPWTTRTRRKI